MFEKKINYLMKLNKVIIPFAFCSILSASDNVLDFKNIKFNPSDNKHNIFEIKDKLYEYIIKLATYSTNNELWI